MKNHLNLDRYKSLDFDERDEIHCEASIGCIEHGSSTFLEVLRFTSIEEDGHIVFPENDTDCFFLFLDHNDYFLRGLPFQTLSEIAKNYDWTKKELQDQYDSYNSDGINGLHMKAIFFNLIKNLQWHHLTFL